MTRILTDQGWRNVMGTDEPAPLMWKWLVLQRDGGCVMAGDGGCGTGIDSELQAHHVITQQKLRKLKREDLRWDVRNGLTLCERHHRRHTRALKRVPFELLRPENVEFAEELQLGWLLEKQYPKTREAA